MLLVNFVDGADVRMIQSGSGLRFSLEAGKRLRILGNLLQVVRRDEIKWRQLICPWSCTTPIGEAIPRSDGSATPF
jgi:hypothetical protein